MEDKIGDILMKSSIVTSFDEALKQAGFRKQSGSWYFNAPDAILVANLQKSNYGKQYYVNLAVWLKPLGKVIYPKEQECHIRIRLSSLVVERIDDYFDEEKRGISFEQRESSIRSLMEERAIPFLRDCSSLKGIRKHIEQGTLRKGFVDYQVEQLVNNNPE